MPEILEQQGLIFDAKHIFVRNFTEIKAYTFDIIFPDLSRHRYISYSPQPKENTSHKRRKDSILGFFPYYVYP